jgi:hypothetical protein
VALGCRPSQLSKGSQQSESTRAERVGLWLPEMKKKKKKKIFLKNGKKA